MIITDIHSHSAGAGRILNIDLGTGESLPQDGQPCSVGFHPWHLPTIAPEEGREMLNRAIDDSGAVAVGEAGFDTIYKGALPIAAQREWFIMQAQVAEDRGLPLIIHAVRSDAELIAMRRRLQPSVPWIIHGFRGKAEQARQLIRAGFYLSMGEHFNEEAAEVARAAGRLLLETDCSPLSPEAVAALHPAGRAEEARALAEKLF